MKYRYDDGGRAEAGFSGDAGDCVVRAIAIAAELPYRYVYDMVNAAAKNERPSKRKKYTARRSARTGIYKTTVARVIAALGWKWTPTMGIGTGCKVHLDANELPPGRLIVSVSKHMCAVINGTVYDNHDPRRDGKRCVYGYWQKEEAP